MSDGTDLLRDGTLELLGRIPWSSNAAFLGEVHHDGETARVIYKPHRGERPLWDFPPGLGVREVAAWVVSEALGWAVVPPTVLRDGPFGSGSVQLYIDADPDLHYFVWLEEGEHEVLEGLRTLCAFDLIVNNADRKAGHCLLDAQRHVWGIDHGLAFHHEPKLRTVIWDFAGEPIPEELRASARAFAEHDLPAALVTMLTPFERDALQTRAAALSRTETFPSDPTGRAYPWPLV